MSISAWLWSYWTIGAAFIAILLAYAYRTVATAYRHFAQLNVPHWPPRLIFGNLAELMFRRLSFLDIILRDYKHFSAYSFYGAYHFMSPTIYVRDLELIKRITHQHFEYFVDHMSWVHDPEVEPFIGRSLFALVGDKWHAMRQTLCPAFSSGRVREMFPLVATCSQRSMEVLRDQAVKAAAANRPWRPDVNDLVSRYANDVIATVAFGVEINSIENPDNQFYRIAMRMMNFDTWSSWGRIWLSTLTFRLPAPFRWRWFDAEIVQHFGSLVLDGMRYRSEFGIRRADMIQLMMEARDGYLERAEQQVDPESGEPLGEVASAEFQGSRPPQWEDEEFVAQCVMFFMTGYSTISTALSFLVYELMVNRDVQQRLADEVDAVRGRLSGGQLDYAALDELKYMDAVIAETMRLWPSGFLLHRRCVKDYVMMDAKGCTVRIDAGHNVCVPVAGIHRDPQYFADPERFDPDRFGEQRKHEIKPFTYLPFGTGQRNCIGSRFAITELKAFAFYLLANFTMSPTATTQIPCRVKRNNGALEIENGLDVQLTPRNV